ncbi:MAG: glycosyltransferase [Flavobacteriales bacterium]|nr:glycosyltransferase [Flavobacteriales bacterium]
MRITIITPSYQQAAYLPECLASVRAQAGAEVEHIVVDGGSTDGSRELLERAEGLAWWCSERDKGQSDAINKGLARATGEVCTWVNSDDAVWPGALARVAEAFAHDKELLAFGGRLMHRSAEGDTVFPRLSDATDTLRLYCEPVINQPATYLRTSAVKAVGGVDPALRYVMDLELWWQLLFRFGHAHLRFTPEVLAMFRLHEESKTVTAHAGFLAETATLLHGMCVGTGQPALARVLALAHPLVQGLRGVPVGEEHAPLVRDMAVHFLLKWHGHVHERADHRAMKALRRAVRRDQLRFVDAAMAARWDALDRQLAIPSWTLFRLRRKLRHLRR